MAARVHGRLSPSQGFEVLFWLALAAAVFGLGFVYGEELEMYRYGTTSWPQALAILVALAALGQLHADLRGPAGEPDDRGGLPRLGTRRLGHHFRLASMLMLPVIYTLLLDYTGYYVTTPFFLAGYLYLAGEQRPKMLIAVPAATYLVLTFVFTTLLYLGLPVGYWPGFYDMNNWVVGLFR